VSLGTVTLTGPGTLSARTFREGWVTSSVASAVFTAVQPLTPQVLSHSILVQGQPFDATRWTQDGQYRAQYLADQDPGRVWVDAAPESGAPSLRAQQGTWFTVAAAGQVTLEVIAAPGAPVTFTATDEGVFATNGRGTITVAANGVGVASTVFVAGHGGRAAVLAGSPLALGTIRLVIEVSP
jgi:hypothetical protein